MRMRGCMHVCVSGGVVDNGQRQCRHACKPRNPMPDKCGECFSAESYSSLRHHKHMIVGHSNMQYMLEAPHSSCND